MNKILIEVEIPTEFWYENYQDYRNRDKNNEIKIKEGDKFEIACISCRVIKVQDEKFEIEVLTSLPEKFATCLNSEIEELSELEDRLSSYVSSKDEEKEINFYLEKIKFFSGILLPFCELYDLKKCPSCWNFIALDREHVENNDGQHFCSYNCKCINNDVEQGAYNYCF